MMRQKSMSTIRLNSKQKKCLLNNNLTKKVSTQNSANIIASHMQQIKQSTSKNKNYKKMVEHKREKEELVKMAKKSKSKIIVHPQKIAVKQQNNAIHIKNDLKKLITKNANGKVKHVQAQNDFLKKIEMLRQKRNLIQVKQVKITSKRGSINKIDDNLITKLKEKRKSSKYLFQATKKNVLDHQNRKQSQKQPRQLKTYTNLLFKNYGSARFSLDSNPIGVQRSQIQQALKIKPVKRQETNNKQILSPEQLNFIQIFKKYKKSFSIQNIKIDKSSQKKHETNTSQSKNSSLAVSYQNICQKQESIYISSKINDNTRSNTYTVIQSSIQDHKFLQEGQAKQILCRQIENVNQRQPVCFKKDMEKNQFSNKFRKTIQIDVDVPKKPIGKFEKRQQISNKLINSEQKIYNLEHQIEDEIQQINHQNFEEKIVPFELFQQQAPKEGYITQIIQGKQKITYSSNNISPVHSKPHSEKKFQNSKYYVEPIPQFQPKIQPLQSQSSINNEDCYDSLLGCQIDLIQKNIIYDEELNL